MMIKSFDGLLKLARVFKMIVSLIFFLMWTTFCQRYPALHSISDSVEDDEDSSSSGKTQSKASSSQEKMKKYFLNALDVISFIETTGEGFSAVANNQDGQLMSWGVLQWNFGQNTLQPLLAEIIKKDEAKVKKIFQDLYPALKQLSTASVGEASALAHNHFLSGIEIRPEWRAAFVALGKEKIAQESQMKRTKEYFDGALKELRHLKFKTVRSFLTIFQNAVQNGFTYQHEGNESVSENYRAWLKSNGNKSEKEKLTKLATELLMPAVPEGNRWIVLRRMNLCIKGEGEMNGVQVNLKSEYGINLDDQLPAEYLAPGRPEIIPGVL